MEKLLTNEMNLVNKIKDNLPSKNDPKHDGLLNDAINVLHKKSNFAEPIVLACKCLSDYLNDNNLCVKHANKKLNEGLVDDLLKIQDNYIDNPEVMQATSNVLSNLALRKPQLKKHLGLYGRCGGSLDTLQSGNDKFKPKGGIERGDKAFDGLSDDSKLKDLLNEFHNNLQKDYNKNKDNILENEEDINENTQNIKSIEPLLLQQFIDDLNKAVDKTTKDDTQSPTTEKLLTNEMNLINKIKDNLPTKSDPKHEDLLDDTLKILNKQTPDSEPVLLACKCLSNYITDDNLYKDHLEKKAKEPLVDDILLVKKQHSKDPQVLQEIDNLLGNLALKNPKLNGYIKDNTKLGKDIDDLKDRTNLYDETHTNDAIKDFHEDVQKDFNDNKVKEKIQSENEE